jgi:hypothetical protein
MWYIHLEKFDYNRDKRERGQELVVLKQGVPQHLAPWRGFCGSDEEVKHSIARFYSTIMLPLI